MDDDERDECLTEIRITIARMRTDIRWLKKIITGAALVACAALGVQLPDIFIHA